MDCLTVNLEAQLTPHDVLVSQCVAALSTAIPQKLNPITKGLIKNLNHKLTEYKSILVKVDKGQSSIIMDRHEYDNKLLQFIHKDNAPMRPVVSFINAPTYYLAEKVDFWIKTCYHYQSAYAIHSSAEVGSENQKEIKAF